MEDLVGIAKRVAISIVLLACALYIADYLVLRYKVANQNTSNPFGSVTVYYGTPLKNGKVEVFFDQPQQETCVHSIFPRLGDRPCWYASRKNIKIISLQNSREPSHSVSDSRHLHNRGSLFCGLLRPCRSNLPSLAPSQIVNEL